MCRVINPLMAAPSQMCGWSHARIVLQHGVLFITLCLHPKLPVTLGMEQGAIIYLGVGS